MNQFVDQYCAATIYGDFKNKEHSIEGIRARLLERPAVVAKRLNKADKSCESKVTQIRKSSR